MRHDRLGNGRLGNGRLGNGRVGNSGRLGQARRRWRSGA
jgi:hypothetical protein